MIRHRSGPANRAESSSDDEDAFATLALKKQKRTAAAPSQVQAVAAATAIESEPSDRHNAVSDAAAPKRQVAHDDRAAKMQALLLELHQEQQKVDIKQHERQRRDGSRNPRQAPAPLQVIFCCLSFYQGNASNRTRPSF
jgi:hypothetical protein